MKYRIIIGGIIACILLILYSSLSVFVVFKVAACAGDPDCTDIMLHQGIIYVLTTVGGLVSALVVSRMTITSPGADPAAFRSLGVKQPRIVNIIVWSYLVIWTFTGCATLVAGVILFPGICKTLADLGTTWLGIAVAAVYAYFNIDPK
jgi:hypothetical protein